MGPRVGLGIFTSVTQCSAEAENGFIFIKGLIENLVVENINGFQVVGSFNTFRELYWSHEYL
jgi:hypothetical protein